MTQAYKTALWAALGMFLIATAALAQYPRPDHMRTVRNLAYQLREDAYSLYQIASQRSQRRGEDQEYSPEWRLRRLYERADAFYNSVDRNYNHPERTTDEYADLARTYSRSSRIFDDLRGSRLTEVPARRVQSSMNALVSYYQTGGGGEWRLPYRELQRIAYELQSSLDRAYDRARSEYDRGGQMVDRPEVTRRALDRLGDARNAAQSFYNQIVKYQGDIGHINEEYGALRREVDRAARRVSFFSGGVQDDFYRAQRLTERLSYIRPEGD